MPSTPVRAAAEGMPIPLDAIDYIDRLDQISDELTTIWLALGNTTDMEDDYLLHIRETLNGTAFRLREVRRAMTDAAGVA